MPASQLGCQKVLGALPEVMDFLAQRRQRVVSLVFTIAALVDASASAIGVSISKGARRVREAST